MSSLHGIRVTSVSASIGTKWLGDHIPFGRSMVEVHIIYMVEQLHLLYLSERLHLNFCI